MLRLPCGITVMLTMSATQRLWFGAMLVAVSALLLLGAFAGVLSLSLWADGKSDATATVAQYRSNVTASTTPTLSVPTQTNIAIAFPAEMTTDETRSVSLKVERFVVGLDIAAGSASDEVKFEKKMTPVKALGRDVEVKLVSSGFDIQGLSTAKEGTPFPLRFTWTLTPKKEGRHELLIDLSEFVRDSRVDSDLIGATDVRLRGAKIDLQDGTALPVVIQVAGPFGVPSWIVTAGASIPGFIGFLLTYPLFVDWLKRRRSLNRDARVQGTPSDQADP